MRKLLIIAGVLIGLLLLGGCEHKVNEDISWQKIKDGFYYADFVKDERDILLVKIDPKLFHFEIYENKNLAEAKTISDIQEKEGAVLSFNGSFFGEDFRPVTLLKSEGKILHKLSKANLVNGVFVITKDNQPKLIEAEKYTDDDKIDFAIQNGPILLDENGESQIISDTGKMASRTALGVDNENNVVLLIMKDSLFTSGNSITLYKFAELLQKWSAFRKMGLNSVLNLDGGPSTGVMIGTHYFPEMDKVQNVVMVKDKN